MSSSWWWCVHQCRAWLSAIFSLRLKCGRRTPSSLWRTRTMTPSRTQSGFLLKIFCWWDTNPQPSVVLICQRSVGTAADSGLKIILRQSPCMIHEMYVSVQFQRTNEQVFINVEAENNRPINNASFFTHGLPCFHPRPYEMLVNNTAKKSWAGNWLKKKKEEEKNKAVMFGSKKKSGIKGSHKQHVWNEITTAASSVDVENRPPADVKIFKLLLRNGYILYGLGYTGYTVYHG